MTVSGTVKQNKIKAQFNFRKNKAENRNYKNNTRSS